MKSRCLAALLFLAWGLFAGCSMSNPQDDALPEPTVLGRIDIDANGSVDFDFTERSSGRIGDDYKMGLWGRPDTGKVFAGTSGRESPYPPVLDAGQRIGATDSTSTWVEYGWLTRGDAYANDWRGPYIGDTPRYVGVRLLREDGMHYGWIQLNIDTTGAGRYPLNDDSTHFSIRRPKLRVYDYAIHPEAQVPIRAGE